MPPTVILSEKTRDLIDQIRPMIIPGLSSTLSSMELKSLIAVLKALDAHSPSLFLLESLRAALLHDLRYALIPKEAESQRVNWLSQLAFWLLTIGGFILAVCEGYDAVSTILPLVSAPVWVSQLLIGVFVTLSVAAFYAFDLSQISDNLGVKLPESRQLLDVFSEQACDMKLIRKYIKHQIHHSDLGDLTSLIEMLDMLKHQQQHLNAKQQIYKKQFENPYLLTAKRLTGIITGLLFFSSGYFVSQTPAMVFFTLLGLSAQAMIWPVFMASSVLGFAAFALYWYLQRPGVDTFIAKLFGLDQEKIDGLNPCKENASTGETVDALLKLERLEAQLESKHQYMMTQGVSPRHLVEPVISPFFSRMREEKWTQTVSPEQSQAAFSI